MSEAEQSDIPPELLAVLRDKRIVLPSEVEALRTLVPALLERARRAEARIAELTFDPAPFIWAGALPSDDAALPALQAMTTSPEPSTETASTIAANAPMGSHR